MYDLCDWHLIRINLSLYGTYYELKETVSEFDLDLLNLTRLLNSSTEETQSLSSDDQTERLKVAISVRNTVSHSALLLS